MIHTSNMKLTLKISDQGSYGPFGSNIGVDSGFAGMTLGTELAAGNLTLGNRYKITARNTAVFTNDGAPDNNVGTYFTANATTVTLDATNKVQELLLDNWNEGDYVGHTGSANSVTVTGDQAGVVTLEQGYMDWSKPCWEDKVDAAGRMAITDGNTITITDLDRDEDCYKYWDMGAADYFVTAIGFTHYVDVNTSGHTGVSVFAPYVLTSVNDDLFDIVGAAGDFIAVFMFAAPQHISIREVSGGGWTAGNTVSINEGTNYYLTINIDISIGVFGTAYLYIYTDAARTTLFGTSTLTLTKDFEFDHIGMSSYNDNKPGRAWSGTVENLSIFKKPAIGKTYKISTIAVVNAGSYITEYGSADGPSRNITGNHYDHVIAVDNDHFKIKYSADFDGIIKTISIQQLLG